VGIVSSWFIAVRELLDFTLFTAGGSKVTIWTLLYLLFLFVLLLIFSRKTKKWLTEKILTKSSLNLGARMALATIIRYFVIFIGVVIILQTAGINLTALHVLAGTVGIGLGFGLQNILSNFISGIIILFERHITVGDRIEVGGIGGDVVAIKTRSTTVMTNDNIAIVIPNSKFITENVVNWSLNGSNVRFRVPVTVACDSDLRRVVELLEDVARCNPDVLGDPSPSVEFLQFGNSGLNLELRVWSTTLTHRKATLISALNFSINEKFLEHGIEIPYPQLEIRFRNGIPGGGPLELPGEVVGDS
jgi:small-conductance mechanosensitive channel